VAGPALSTSAATACRPFSSRTVWLKSAAIVASFGQVCRLSRAAMERSCRDGPSFGSQIKQLRIARRFTAGPSLSPGPSCRSNCRLEERRMQRLDEIDSEHIPALLALR
jgi:hypothetical protein